MTTLRETLESLYVQNGSLLKSLTTMGYPPETWGNLPFEVKQALGLDQAPEVSVCSTCGDQGYVLTI